MFFSNLKVGQKLLLGIFSPLLLLIFLGGSFYYGLNRLHETQKQVSHTQRVISDAQTIVTSAVNIETGMRGYLLTGQEPFLEPYLEGSQRVYEQLDTLRKAGSDNPKQVARLWDAESILHEWQDRVTEPTIALRRIISKEKGMHDIAQITGEQRSLHYTKKIHQQIEQFIEEEKKHGRKNRLF